MPFWNGAAYRSILRCLFTGRIIDGPELEALESQIVESLGVVGAMLCGSGSLALELALRMCAVRAGDEVIIPTFCCSAVVPPILATGATPVLADSGEELNLTASTVEAALTQKTRAIVVPHLFGNPADIDVITQWAHAKNIRVIDDAAQALGATIDGQKVGSFGDMGVLSFGAEKVCFGLGGGALVSRTGDAIGAARELPLIDPGRVAVVTKLLSTLVQHRWRKWTLPLQRMLALGHIKNPDAAPDPYRSEKIANLNAAVAATLLSCLPENLASRRARVQAYRHLLGNEPDLELIRHRPGSACLTQVVRVLPKRRGDDAAARMIRALSHAGYEIQGSYVPIHLIAQFSQCVWDRLPCAERIWADLIELPCEPEVALGDVERIATIVKRSLARG